MGGWRIRLEGSKTQRKTGLRLLAEYTINNLSFPHRLTVLCLALPLPIGSLHVSLSSFVLSVYFPVPP